MTLKRFFACGLPRGPNMRIRLLAAAPVASPSASKPTVALIIDLDADVQFCSLSWFQIAAFQERTHQHPLRRNRQSGALLNLRGSAGCCD